MKYINYSIESTLYRIFLHSLVLYQKSHSFSALTHLIFTYITNLYKNLVDEVIYILTIMSYTFIY